jgi:hypothetical membrane protein
MARIAGRAPLTRPAAIAGIAGPAAFTCAWIVASLRQSGHSVSSVQLSGLAAPDARDPWIMIVGFVALGGCTAAFGGALHRALGGSAHPGPGPRPPGAGFRRPGPGPRLIQCAGALTVAAGLLRRDHMMLVPPGTAGGESWHNQAHDAVSSIIYVTLVVAPLLLAARFRGDPGWRRLCAPLMAGSAATAALLGVFASASFTSWDAILQRVAVTIPLALLVAVAVRLMTAPPAQAGPAMSAVPAHASQHTTSQ